MLEGKKVLITGGAGTIGSALAKEVLSKGPAVVRILDNDETKLFELEQEIADNRVRYLLGDVRDKERLYSAVRNIDIVFHAAALKHVHSSEYNPFEAVKTNVLGIQNLIDACIDEDAEKVVFTSSDKAANPANVMGTTKLLGEKLITAANYYKGSQETKFSSVRFGNVLGSRGSLVPIVEKQIRNGGPITVTDPDMTRFYMTEKDAINMIFKVLFIMHGGEVFVLKMPVFRVGDIIEVIMEKKEELVDTIVKEITKKAIERKTIGPKSGEKPHEELMTIEESKRAIELDDMFVILPDSKELVQKNGFDFKNSKKAKIGDYASNKEKISTKDELKRALAGLL